MDRLWTVLSTVLDSDVETFAVALSHFACRTQPTWLPDAQQYFAQFDVVGSEVEISTVEWRVDNGTTECAGVGPWRHFVAVRVGDHVVPAVSLELRLVSELVRGRADRYEPLIEHMRHNGADLLLLTWAMDEQRVDPELRERVVALLTIR